MNENKVMALLLGECWHELKIIGGINGHWHCTKCNQDFIDSKCRNMEHDDIMPAYHDSKNRMTLETMDKIQEMMPGVWEKYLKDRWNNKNGRSCAGMLQTQLHFSNFIRYLKGHKEEWAYVECNVDCFGNDDFYKPDDCMGCDGKNRQILNPAYAEALRELEEGE